MSQYQPGASLSQPIPADAKNMAVVSHLSSLGAMLLTANTLSIIAPLIFWFIYKDKPGYGFTRESTRRAFNFNFNLWLINSASIVLTIVTLGLAGILVPVVLLITGAMMLIFHILGAIAASRGEIYDYPFTFWEIIK